MAAKAERAGFASLWVMDRVLAPLEPRTPYPASMDGELPGRAVLGARPVRRADPRGDRHRAYPARHERARRTVVLPAAARPHVDGDRPGEPRPAVGRPRRSAGRSTSTKPSVHRSTTAAVALDEIIDVLEAIWADGITHVDGERYEIAPSEILPKPAQRPRPPLLLAAYTPSALDRVAQTGRRLDPRRSARSRPSGRCSPVSVTWPPATDVIRIAIELVVRANASITERPLDGDRPAYHGSIDQIADDLDATRRVGAHEIVVDLQGSAATRRRTLRPGHRRDVTAPRRRVTRRSACAVRTRSR